MGQVMAALQLEQPLKIMGLISLNADPFHHMQDHLVVIASDLITVESLRSEIAGNAQSLRFGDDHGR